MSAHNGQKNQYHDSLIVDYNEWVYLHSICGRITDGFLAIMWSNL